LYIDPGRHRGTATGTSDDDKEQQQQQQQQHRGGEPPQGGAGSFGDNVGDASEEDDDAVDRDDPDYELVWQNERWLPGLGWSSRHLFSCERKVFTSKVVGYDG
jgi:hypothetical protein